MLTIDHWGLEFAWRGDRFTHRLLRRDGQSWRPFVNSIEGDESDRWPPSPPLQQLHIERQTKGEVALLVGMAGASHWSLSVELLPGEILWRVACRVKENATRLTSAYELASNNDGPGDDGDWFVCDDCQLETAHDRLMFSASCLPNELPATITWGYGWRWRQ